MKVATWAPTRLGADPGSPSLERSTATPTIRSGTDAVRAQCNPGVRGPGVRPSPRLATAAAPHLG